MKRIILLTILILNCTISMAPILGDKIREEKLELVRVRVEEIRKERIFIKFSDHLGYKESSNNPDTINKIGCFGEHQWKESTLHYIGYTDITLRGFRKDPSIFPREIQREALKTLLNTNWILLHDYQNYVGDTVGGVIVTKSGMLAAAHLGGAGSVKLFLLSRGRVNNRDIFKTSVRDYLREFRGYDL